MSGDLRDALEKIKAELDERSSDGEAHLFLNIPYWQLEELLAAHPAGPVPAVTDDATQAALEIAMDDGHNGIDCRPARDFGDTMRAALKAAAPLLGPRPLLDREAVNTWIKQEIDRAIAFHAATNGTGHQFSDDCDGWVALTAALQLMHDDAHELVELARPMPTQEQIAATLSACGPQRQIDEWADEYHNRRAAAVLALINGETKCTCPTGGGVTPEDRTDTGQHLVGCALSTEVTK